MRSWLPIILLGLLFGIWSLTSGCKGGEGDGDADTDVDGDGDAVSDGDADADGDGDADVDGDVGTDADGDGESDAAPDGDADSDNDLDSDVGDGGEGDADFDADTDAESDSDADSEADADIEVVLTSPITSSVTTGCPAEGAQFGDVYALEAGLGESIEVEVDTVRALTSSNLAAFLFTDLEDVLPTYVVEGDDEIDCSHPPIFGRCPRFTWVVEARHTGTFYIFVSPVDACTDPTNAEYRLSVTIGDDHAELTRVRNELALAMPE